MLFLGTIDDKTIEYPYGPTNDNSLNIQNLILHHLLFGNDELVIEEGFLLAAPEAIFPDRVKPFLLPAIKHGLIKIASRYGDVKSYVEERRRNKHASPPDNGFGNRYIQNLQNACDSSNAFLNYPDSDIDEITFQRFAKLLSQENAGKLFDLAELNIPKQHTSSYEKTYLHGNAGKRWTARSAWEATAKNIFKDRQDIIHSVMCLANRERQILRAVAIAEKNNVQMKVETGFDVDNHEFADSITINSISKKHSKIDNIFPRVCVKDIMENIDPFFEKIGNNSSLLCDYRNSYVKQFNNYLSSSDPRSLSTISEDYQDEIYKTIGVVPLEKNLLLNIVGTASLSWLFSGFISAFLSHRTNKKGRLDFDDKLKKEFSRREFLMRAGGTALATTAIVADTQAGNIFSDRVRWARLCCQEDTKEIHETFINNLDKSHQILEISGENLNQYKKKFKA